jgi:uncharacterized membrane protein
MSAPISALTIAAALGAALNAGVFFAFSSFVMAGLGRLPSAQGAAAMQSINVTAVRPLFMTALFATAAVCAALIVHAFLTWGDTRATLLLVGGALYVVGTIVVTIARNVPLNDALAPLDPSSAAAAAEWARYLDAWTAWNHVRTVAGLLAAGAFVAALMV